MHQNFYLLISICLLGSSCGFRNETSFKAQTIPKDSLITFFDIDGCSRRELADCLQKANDLAPKLIVLNVLIEKSEHTEDDSLLSMAIKYLDNVIFASAIDGSDLSIVRSADVFNANINNEGILSYVFDHDSVATQYIPLFENQERQALGLPHKIVFNYRPEILEGSKWFRVNEPVKILYTKTMENFHVMNKHAISTESVRDKIVIFGWLGPGDEDTSYIVVDNNKIKSHSSIVTANVVLNILSEQLNRRNIMDN